MTSKQIIKTDGERVKVSSHADWKEFLARVQATMGGAAARGGGCEDDCDDVCTAHGGCDFCGGGWAVCNDGDVFLIDP